MSKMTILLEHKRMPTSAMSALDQKCLEQLYYSLLFGSPAYRDRKNKYLQWLNMGFDVAVKEQPREALPADRLRFNTASLSNKMEIVIVDGNVAILKTLSQIIQKTDAIRMSTDDAAARVDACLSMPSVKEHLIQPLTDSMIKDELREHEKTRFLEKIREAFAVLTEDNVSHFEAKLPVMET